MLFGVVSVALMVVACVYFRVLHPASRPTLKTVPLTSYPGMQISPAFSPDGKQVAFAWDGEKGENLDIYVKLLDAGTPLRLTSSPTADWAPAWSPDARYIAFCRDKYVGDTTVPRLSLNQWVSGHIGIWIIGALGGAERKLGESTGCGLSWSPDGKYLALANENSPHEPYSIFLLSVETGDKRKLTSPPTESVGDWSPQFSPDGKTLAFVRVPLMTRSICCLSLPMEGHGVNLGG